MSNKNKIYVKCRDNSSSYTVIGQGKTVGGAENLPVLVKNTPEVQRALHGRALILVHSTDAKKLLGKKFKEIDEVDVQPFDADDEDKNEDGKDDKDKDKNDVKPSIENVQAALDSDDYAVMTEIAREIDPTIKGNTKRSKVVDFLETFLNKS